MKVYLTGSLMGLIALGCSQSAVAQDKEAPKSQRADQTLGDIVVTARRSNESLQTVPLSVTAISGKFLETQNIQDASSLPRLASNLTIQAQTSSLSAATIFIRGIGSGDPATVADQAVGIYLDGVYLARSAGALFDLLDMERVEVLRGPQGTLFGRNTIGGAIQFVSKKPTDDMHATVKAGIGRFNDRFIRGRIDTGLLSDSLPIKMSFSAQHREADGYVNNILTPSSQDPGALNADTMAFALEGDFGKFKVNYNFDYDDRNGTPAYFQIVAASPMVATYYGRSAGLGGAAFVLDPNPRDNVEQAGFLDNKGQTSNAAHSRVQGHSLTLSYEVSPALTIKSITGYRRFSQESVLNLTGNGVLKGVVLDFTSPTLTSVQTVLPYNGYANPMKQHQFSQEFQFLGSSGDFNYLAGLYYFHEKSEESNRQGLTYVLPANYLSYFGLDQATVNNVIALNPGLDLIGVNLSPVQAFGGTTTSKAIFGQVSWKPSSLGQRLELTLGGRYTSDKKSVYLAGDVSPVLRDSTKFNNFSWLASLSYKVTPDIMVYTRASTGYRSGGINPRTNVINKFGPEKATAFEAGMKSEFLDHRLRLNLAAFLTDYKDMQVPQFAAGSGGATQLIVNAGKVRLTGFEAEMAIKPVKGLTIDGSVGYVNTKYKTFLFRDPNTNLVSNVANIAKPTYTPKWTAQIGGEFAQPIGSATARLRFDYSYRSSSYFNALDLTAPFNENIRSPGDKNLRARLSIEDIKLGGGVLDIGVWGDNLTDERPINFGLDFGSLGFAGVTFKKPRTYGFDAKLSF